MFSIPRTVRAPRVAPARSMSSERAGPLRRGDALAGDGDDTKGDRARAERRRTKLRAGPPGEAATERCSRDDAHASADAGHDDAASMVRRRLDAGDDDPSRARQPCRQRFHTPRRRRREAATERCRRDDAHASAGEGYGEAASMVRRRLDAGDDEAATEQYSRDDAHASASAGDEAASMIRRRLDLSGDAPMSDVEASMRDDSDSMPELGSVSDTDSEDDDGDDFGARAAAVASSYDGESRSRAGANAGGTDRAAEAPALGPTGVVACGEASGERVAVTIRRASVPLAEGITTRRGCAPHEIRPADADEARLPRGKAHALDDEAIVRMLRLRPKDVRHTRTREAYRDFFAGVPLDRVERLLAASYADLEPDAAAAKVAKRLALVRGTDSDDGDGEDSGARAAAVASSHDNESQLRASANADGTDRAAEAPALGPTRVVACGEASGERHHSAS